MIKEIVLENVMAKEKDELDLVIGPERGGKILKVFVRFPDEEEERTGVKLKLLTKEGEEILNIENKDEKRLLFYPRVNIASRKYEPNRNTLESEESDYFYFLNGLLLSLKMDNLAFKGVLLEKIRIVYEEL